MKNVRNLLAAVCALLSATTMAVVYQPGAHVSEDAPLRVGAGLGAGLVYNKEGDKGGFGIRNTGLGLSFAHNVGYDFTYGVALGGGIAAMSPHRALTKDAEKGDGFGFNIDALARFMPEIADGLRLGGRLNLGYNHFFLGNDNAEIKAKKDAIKFPGIKVFVGPALDWRATDMVSLYVSPALGLNNAVRLPTKEGDEAVKKTSNLLGFEIAIEGSFAISENMGVTVNTTTNLNKLNEFNKNDFKQDVVAGVNFAM